MKHNFTESELRSTLTKADRFLNDGKHAGIGIYGGGNGVEDAWAGYELESLRAILDALPEPATDDWQECAWGDVLHTDERVKAEYISGTALEGVPDGISDDGINLVDGNFIPYSTDAKWYRIPAPVRHPDPAKHPVILVTEYDVAGNSMECEPTPFFAHDGVYKNHVYAHRPDDVLSWTPGKVVEDDR